MKKSILLSPYIFAIILAACGGEGDLPGSGVQPTPTSIPTAIPTSTPTAVPTQIPTVVPTQNPNIGNTLSGRLNLSANMIVDSDNNDPTSSFADNSSFENAQVVDNRTRIHGFATLSGTNFSGDVFQINSDVFDVYAVSLQEGQFIQMQVVDYVEDTDESRYSGDLDLYLVDSAFNTVASSLSTTEFESVIVPADGNYYVVIEAFSGASKYVLTIGIESQAADFDFDQNMPVSALIPGEAIVKNKINSAQIQKVSSSPRASLVSLSSTDDNLQKSAALNAPLLATLKQKNPDAFAKYETLKKIKTLRLSGEVEYASPNYLLQAYRQPNDEFYPFQWHYPLINLPQAWDITTGEAAIDVIVAVIDTGVFLSHPDLQSQLVPGFDFISDPNIALDGDGIDSNPDDPGDAGVLGQSSWHGTHVAGTVAAQTNTSAGVAGTSWGAKIMPLRVLGRGGGSSYDIMQSVLFAAGLANDSGTVPSQRADIINLSLGGGSASQAEADVYQQVVNSGVIVVAAAGNENTSQLSYPASYPGVISVSAVDINGDRASYSNFGSEVDIAAPGGDGGSDVNGDGYPDQVLSTVVDDASGSRRPAYSFQAGTSMASPHVAGVLALMKAVHPELSPTEVDSLLSNGALTNDSGNPGRDDIFGFGLIDALKCVQAAQDLANGGQAPERDPLVVSSRNNLNLTSSLSESITLRNQGGGTPVLNTVTTTKAWISVNSSGADLASGIGSWTITVDQNALIDGTHVGRVDFNFDHGTLPISVTTTVGDFASIDGQASQLFLLLLDWNSDAVLTTILVDEEAFTWSISDVPAGEYYIAAGSDIDNDGFVCQFGESCGAYPNINRFEKITVNSDRSDLNFSVDILSNSIAAQAQVNDKQQKRSKSVLKLPR